MVATGELKLASPKAENDLRWATAYFADHPANPEYAQPSHWKVVFEDDEPVANIGLNGNAQTIVITDLYCEPSRRGVSAVKWFLRGLKAFADAGKVAQVMAPKASRSATRWWKEVFGNEPYVVHFYNGGRF